LIDDALEPMKPLADQAGVRLERGPSAGVLFADRDRLLQTLTNLIGNAIKFSPPGAAVRVSAWTEERDVRFLVEDEGRGIPPEKLLSIFERFQQVDATDSREKGGSGLGLAICSSIVRQHGGEIWAESDGTHGSRFIFTFPRVQRATLPATHQALGTVVVCEDDDELREIEIELLEEAGYRAIGFSDGATLLGSNTVASADVILLDLGLPDIDGREVVDRLKANPETRDVPIVIVSGYLQSAAVTAWICKPRKENELLPGLPSRAHSDPAKARVLIVEDDVDRARVLIESFQRLGVTAVHAATGREAIVLAESFNPELILLDLMLPEIDGFGVIEALEDHHLLPRVPLVVYSASEPTPSERERLGMGPMELLTKSRVSPEDFERHVIRLLDAMVAGRREVGRVA
jgi:CheY-like chemotaxis protein